MFESPLPVSEKAGVIRGFAGFPVKKPAIIGQPDGSNIMDVFIVNPEADSFDLRDEIDKLLTQAKAITEVMTGAESEAVTDTCIAYSAWCLSDLISSIKVLSDAEWKIRHGKPESVRAA